jgi:hypothetical protein
VAHFLLQNTLRRVFQRNSKAVLLKPGTEEDDFTNLPSNKNAVILTSQAQNPKKRNS